MKKTIIAMALLAASAANAEVVTVSGYGETYEKALRSCQITASAKVTGSWIASEQRLNNDKVSEDIVTYDGAIINRTDVLSYNNNAMVCEVDVDPVKDNKVITKDVKTHVPTAEIKKLNQDALAIAEALDWVDNRKRAWKPIVKDITYKPKGKYTVVYMDVEVIWDPKWVDDVKNLMKKRNLKAKNTSNVGNELLGSIVNVFATSGHPIFAAAAGEMLYDMHEKSNDYQICFGRKSVAKDCYYSGGALSMLRQPSMEIIIDGLDKKGERVEWFVHKQETKGMYDLIYPNKSVGHNGLLNTKVVYMSPGVAIYTEKSQRVRFGFTILSDQLDKIEEFELYIEE